MTARWCSQLVPPMGAISAQGIKNQLGRPAFDRFVVLIREAAQNSWDARDEDAEGPVRFELDLTSMDGDMAERWRTALGNEAPSPEHLPLRNSLAGPFSVLFVSDRGTLGLGGPTRADSVAPDQRHDYVSFILNVGEPRDVEHGGGTYGFGKAVFYLTSAASSVLVHTRWRNEHGVVGSRLIGCALGSAYSTEGRSHTGRHWFGLPMEDPNVVEPLVGKAADDLAAALGFPPFADELGTTIAIIQPKLDGRTHESAAEMMTHAILWHLWPKLVDHGRGPAMRFAVRHNGCDVPLPDPATHPGLKQFVAALKSLDSAGEDITYRASRPVGKIRLITAFDPPPPLDPVATELGFADGIRHCCLLRTPELVVEYRPGPPIPNEHVWYAGVFRALPDFDKTFANAEPPTHDSWVPGQLDEAERSIVKTTLRKIDEKLRSHALPRPTEHPAAEADGLAGMSRLLGSLLAPASGDGAGPSGGNGGTGNPRTNAVRMTGPPRWVVFNGQQVLAQAFDLDTRRTITVEAAVAVRVWGGTEKPGEIPEGASRPEVICWRKPDATELPAGRVGLGPDDNGRWEVLVRVPADTMIRVRVREAREEILDADD
jgi:hypothetical protein